MKILFLIRFLISCWCFSPEDRSFAFSFFSISILEKVMEEKIEKLSPKFGQQDLEKGEKLFNANCTACHLGRNNVIIPEKDLKKETLEANGMNSVEAITYQVKNGKNGMPAFGGRLSENEITQIANYLVND
jgi:cytochrome c6